MTATSAGTASGCGGCLVAAAEAHPPQHLRPPDHLIAHSRCLEIGEAEGSTEHLEAATKHLEAANEIVATLNDSSADTLLARANLFRQTGNRKQILNDFESPRGRPHEHAAFSNYCATLFYLDRQYDKARQIYKDLERAGTETGVYAYSLFVNLDDASQEDMQRQCHAMFANRPSVQETAQSYSDWTICRLVGETELAEEAADRFIQEAKAMQKDEWLIVGEFMKGKANEVQLVGAFSGRRFEVAHAHFLIAIDRLSRGDRTGARESFQNVIDTNVCRFYVSWWSEAFLERLEDPNWIPWLPNPSEPEEED